MRSCTRVCAPKKKKIIFIIIIEEKEDMNDGEVWKNVYVFAHMDGAIVIVNRYINLGIPSYQTRDYRGNSRARRIFNRR